MIAALLFAVLCTPPPAAKGIEVDCSAEQFCYADLASKYANERNFVLAEYFLCLAKEEMAEAEHEGMVAHLQQMKRGANVGPLSFCDHVTSGYGMSYCSAVAHGEAMPRLDARIDRVKKNAKLAALRERADAFVGAEAERIGDSFRGGTAQASMGLGAEVDAKTQFVELLERVAAKRAGAATADAEKKADAALNAAYREARKELDEEATAFLRDAQRAWIAYRDAFAAYYIERWRGTAAEDVLRREIVTLLTRERTSELLEEE